MVRLCPTNIGFGSNVEPEGVVGFEFEIVFPADAEEYAAA
jgi:hypothetical protein